MSESEELTCCAKPAEPGKGRKRHSDPTKWKKTLQKIARYVSLLLHYFLVSLFIFYLQTCAKTAPSISTM